MRDITTLYQLWLAQTAAEPALFQELQSVAGQEDAIRDRFYQDLQFGTAGLRGVLGAGTNRMNVFTVNQATQGLANYLNAQFSAPCVAIAYDSRINSARFAQSAACVLAANGIRVHLFAELVPTPMLSFAVRALKCQSGIIITASHNPAKYNGYKCYDPNGYQMTDHAAEQTQGYIAQVDAFRDVKTMDYAQALAQGHITMIPPALQEAFYEKVLSCRVRPDTRSAGALQVIYTPLNGAGNKPVREVLRRAGFSSVSVVAEQEQPDGNFPSCPYPNPEIKEAFALAMRQAEQNPADLLLATDPDCDRVGIAVREQDGYTLLSGNDVGVLLTEYLLRARKESGTLPERPVITKSLVTTPFVDAVAAQYGCEVVSLLTGFKYIGEYISALEQNGEEARFVLGMEESYGYLAGTHARDKDAVVGSLLICEMAAYYKARGKTLTAVLQELSAQYGVYDNALVNFSFTGESGMKQMLALMQLLRSAPPRAIAGLAVEQYYDYQEQSQNDYTTGAQSALALPPSNVLRFVLQQGSSVILRPSGTEPKMKLYITARAGTRELAAELAAKLEADMRKTLHL